MIDEKKSFYGEDGVLYCDVLLWRSIGSILSRKFYYEGWETSEAMCM